MLPALIGWAGAACITLAFYLIAHGHLSYKHGGYYVLNIVGSAGVGISAYATHNWPSVALQLVWIGIALAAIARYRHSSRS